MGLQQLNPASDDARRGKAAIAELNAAIVHRKRFTFSAIYQIHKSLLIAGRLVSQEEIH